MRRAVVFIAVTILAATAYGQFGGMGGGFNGGFGSGAGLGLINDIVPPQPPSKRYEIKQVGQLTLLVDTHKGDTWILKKVRAVKKGHTYRWVSIPKVEPPLTQVEAEDMGLEMEGEVMETDDEGTDPFGAESVPVEDLLPD